jgi:hypothetical protein
MNTTVVHRNPPKTPLTARLSRMRAGRVSPPLAWGVAAGVALTASPLAFWWLPPKTVYALSIILIASVYIGFSVADGRRKVIAVEVGVAIAFVVVATTAITGSAWLLVAALIAHGLKDFWQHRTRYVANTRWWPPFCAAADWVAAALLAVAITTGTDLT